MRLTGADRHRSLEARGHPSPPHWVGRRQPGWRVCSVFLAPGGRCRVSPDLIRVINVPFEAQESLRAVGEGYRSEGGGTRTVSVHLLKACPSGSDRERDREQRDRRKQRETK